MTVGKIDDDTRPVPGEEFARERRAKVGSTAAAYAPDPPSVWIDVLNLRVSLHDDDLVITAEKIQLRADCVEFILRHGGTRIDHR